MATITKNRKFNKKSLKNNPSVCKLCADANHLPLADNSVNMIVSNLMVG
jgi:malonyl-CoA O-methyltransferase